MQNAAAHANDEAQRVRAAEAGPLPRLTVVVPVYRAVGTIARTLESILEQDYPDLQLIVIDGGSDDGTVDVIKRFAADIDYWVSEPDGSQAEALNKGFARADGEVFGWLCADDALTPGALPALGAHLRDHPDVDVVTGGCLRMFDGGVEVKTEPVPDFYDRLDFINTIEQPSTLWRAAAHRAAGELDTGLRYAFDWEYWCRLKRTGARFARLAEPMSVYYFSSDNLTSSGGTKIAEEMYKVIKMYGPYNGRLADIYRFLYYTFDMRGFYDRDAASKIPPWRQKVFHVTLGVLYKIFDKDRINSYNWNFASRQERGLSWT